MIPFQQDIKPIAQYRFALRSSGAGFRILTHCMADYKATLSYLSEHNLRHFTSYPQSDKPIKSVLRHILLTLRHRISPLPFRVWL